MHKKFFVLIFLLVGNIILPQPSIYGDPPARPKYHPVLRFTEDWSVLRDLSCCQKTDFFDRIKYVPLNCCETIWASFGGHDRLRVESWHHFNFKPRESSDTYLLNRLFVHGDFHFGDHFRVFAELKHATSTDRDLPGGRRTLDVDIFGFQNAFADLYFDLGNCVDVTLRGGRQEMLYGKQRLVSPLNWSNTRRTFDGGWLIAQRKDWTATGFWTKPVRIKKYEANDHFDTGEFFGIYTAGKTPCKETYMDLYWLGRTRPSATFNTKTGREERHTIGMRLWGDLYSDCFTYDIEGAYQFGDLGSFDIQAYMLAVEAVYAFPKFCTEPLIGLGFDYASGDDINDTSKSKTFSHLFPLGHAFLGYIDVIGRQNIFDYHAWITCHPMEKMWTTAHFHHFRRASDNDALYNAGAGVVFGATAGSSKTVGSELDLTCGYSFNPHLKGELGYCHFFKGSFVRQAQKDSKSIDFLYSSLLYLF
ncbi:MAG: hypothetical protein K940chlam7_00602 [Chlamydiae bacterium]|nr:hypothetical protein [Chlamydiota bacterium]